VNTRFAAAAIAAALIVTAVFPSRRAYSQQPDPAASRPLPGKHRGAVTALIHRGDEILSAGEDGFLGVWSIHSSSAVSRFQLTPYRITAMSARPGRDEVCLAESDTMGIYRLSVWNYREQRNRYTIRFRDPITYVNYSLGGSFIIAARSGRTALVFLDAETGDLLKPPEPLAGSVSFAVTGRSERNMAAYLTQGILSYWDLASGTETNRFTVPANLHSPVLFGNNRYLAGINADGLQIADAATGRHLASQPDIPPGSLLCAAAGELVCLTQDSQGSVLYRFGLDQRGRLVDRGRATLAAGTGSQSNNHSISAITAAAIDRVAGDTPGGANGIALGTSSGEILLPAMDGSIQPMAYHEPERIIEAAVSGATIAFITRSVTGFIPLDYTRLAAGEALTLQARAAWTRISAVPAGAASAGTFILWQDTNTGSPPVIQQAAAGAAPRQLSGLTLRSPARIVEASGGTILVLDSAGSLQTVPIPPAQGQPFTFFSAGIMDAAFIDRDRVLIGRSAAGGNSPFLIINTATGETVALPYPAEAGVLVYQGESGNAYGAAVEAAGGSGAEADTDERRTVILQLDTSGGSESPRLVEWPGEETVLAFAETQGSIAAAIEGEGAAIYTPERITPFERSGGLPRSLHNGGRSFISLDTDGSIAWHDSRSGKLLAAFRLYPDAWLLERGQSTIQGRILQPDER
jgi:hypothetical protein